MTPSNAQVLAIRQEFDERRLNVRAWAEALDVSLETVRRIARRDTYRAIGRGVEALVRSLPPLDADPAEPSGEEIAASLAKLRGLADKLPEGPEAGERAIEGLRGLGEGEGLSA